MISCICWSRWWLDRVLLYRSLDLRLWWRVYALSSAVVDMVVRFTVCRIGRVEGVLGGVVARRERPFPSERWSCRGLPAVLALSRRGGGCSATASSVIHWS